MAELGTRIAVYSADGKLVSQLTNPLEYTWRVDQDKVATLNLTLTTAVTTHRAVTQGSMLALEQRMTYNNRVVWDEVPNGRFFVTGVTFDSRDITGRFTVEAKGMAWVLQGALVDWQTKASDRTFTKVTADNIMSTLVKAAKARGALTTLYYYGSGNGMGSDSKPITTRLTRTYPVESTLWEVLLDLYHTGELDFDFLRQELRLYAGDRVVNRTGSVQLRPHVTQQLTREIDTSDQHSAFMLRGDGTFGVAREFAPGRLGRREVVLNQAGATDASSATGALLRARQDEQDAEAALTVTWPYQNEETTPVVPGVSVDVGDRVSVRYPEVDGTVRKLSANVSETSLSLRGSGDSAYYEITVTVGRRRHDRVRALADTARALAKGKVGPIGKPKPPIDPLSQIPDGSIPNSKLQNPGSGGGGALTMDETPTAGSRNPVTSSGIKQALDEKQPKQTFDTTPTLNSSNPVTSDGIKRADDRKQDKLTFDATPTGGSSNPVTSGGIKLALDKKQDKLTYDSKPTLNSSNPVTSDGIARAIKDAQPPPTMDAYLGQKTDIASGYPADFWITAEYKGLDNNKRTITEIQFRKGTYYDTKDCPYVYVIAPLIRVLGRDKQELWLLSDVDFINTYDGTLQESDIMPVPAPRKVKLTGQGAVPKIESPKGVTDKLIVAVDCVMVDLRPLLPLLRDTTNPWTYTFLV